MSSSMTWFRMYHEFSSDPKIQMLSEINQRRYVMLLCLRCCNGDVTLQDDEVAFQLRVSNDDWDKTKAVLLAKKLINKDNKPTAWDKRQFTSDSSKNRVADYRARKKTNKTDTCNDSSGVKKECNNGVTLQKLSGNAIDTDTDTDTDTDLTTTTVVENENEGLSLSARKAVAPKEVKQTKSDVQVVFDFWREVMQHDKARLDGKREKCIRDALKIGYSVEELLSAIRGCSLTPHNMGVNEQHQRFDGLAIIFKSADQVDRFIANSINPPQQKSPNAPAKNGSGFEKQRGNYDRNNKISQAEWNSTDF